MNEVLLQAILLTYSYAHKLQTNKFAKLKMNSTCETLPSHYVCACMLVHARVHAHAFVGMLVYIWPMGGCRDIGGSEGRQGQSVSWKPILFVMQFGLV